MSTLFIDESKTRDYIVVAAVVLPADIAAYRASINSLRMKGQRRIHFTTESPERRRKILSALTELSVHAGVYRANFSRERDSRAACLRAVVKDVPRLGVDRIVLEQDDSIVQFDRQLLFTELRGIGMPHVAYDHERATAEPLLAIPDALAWCVARGADWSRRAAPMLGPIRELRP